MRNLKVIAVNPEAIPLIRDRLTILMLELMPDYPSKEDEGIKVSANDN